MQKDGGERGEFLWVKGKQCANAMQHNFYTSAFKNFADPGRKWYGAESFSAARFLCR